ncbi:MAG: endonuclease/exonuclease/phosphatase family protein [Bacteroidales bacterium]|jgi:endonuclease/exonuclease/phosphatase family metal-dependent hydrolase|nr:endonuclease/exonuclease/phosphatase family protein [Bacteroidales bacterium]
MKKILLVILLLVLSFVAFYFWGSSNNWNAKKYNQFQQFTDKPALVSDTLSVMTYNVGWLSGMTNNLPVDRDEALYVQNLRDARSLLNEYHPDIIGFQEIDVFAKRSFYYNQPDSLGINLEYLNGSLAVNWDKKYVPFPYWPFQYHFGKLISAQYVMSNLEILENDYVVLPKPVNAPFYYNAFYLDRLIQKTWVKTSKGELLVMNVHLEAFDQETRIMHVDAVIEEYLKYTDELPVLLIGDFNSRAMGPEGSLNESARKMFEVSGVGVAIADSMFAIDPIRNYTFSSGDPVEKIDYIFYNTKYIKKLDAKVVQEAGEASDHFPVWMQFVLK